MDDIVLYPNPNNGYFSLKVPKKTEGIWFVRNQLGQVVKEQYFSTQAETVLVNVQGLSQGLYYISIELNGQFITKRFSVIGN